MSYRGGQSDRCVVPRKLPNKGAGATPAQAEAVEGRRRAKGNAVQQHMSRRSRRVYDMQKALDGIRQTAKGRPEAKFTTLMHHIYQVERLRAAYNACKRDAAAGVDGQTWHGYGQELEANLLELSDRLGRGGYRPQPVRRAYIGKGDGSQRPLGVPALEDKIVQRATAEVLNAIYEQDFLGFSYGFRPGRSAHDALDAVAVGVEHRKVGWILDADITKFFDTIEHDWLIKFIEHRVGDARVVRLIKKWLHAGVLEDGQIKRSEVGTVQGGSISPLLANVYLHYAFDQWVQQWRRRQAEEGDMIIVRYADDWVAGFQTQQQAQRFQSEVGQRLRRFGLTLHEKKTRLIEFGRYANERRRRRGQGKPQTFDFLGFTHCCGSDRKGRFALLRLSSSKRMSAKLLAIEQALRRRMTHSIDEQGQYLRAVLLGHGRYHGVPNNGPRLRGFRYRVAQRWLKVLRRRGHRRPITWKRMGVLIARWLPHPRICHPHPSQRLIVRPKARAVCGSPARTDL